MKQSVIVIREQIQNFYKAFVFSKYEVKGAYQAHYLGNLWEILNPIIQILIYYFVFGIRLGAGKTIGGNIPYLMWMIAGFVPWSFLSSGIVQGANSVYSRVLLISRMNFPISVLPMVTIINAAKRYIIMVMVFIPFLLINKIHFSVLNLQFFIYFFLSFLFLNATSLLLSTIIVFFRDFRNILSSIMRVLFYLSGVTIEINKGGTTTVNKILSLNPLNFYIEGFRDAFFSRNNLMDRADYLVFNVLLIVFIFALGSIMQVSLKHSFTDYV